MRSIPLLRVIIDVLLVAAVWLPVVILKYGVEPHRRGFYCSDLSIRYPFKDSTVTSEMLYSVGHLLPVVAMLSVEAYRTFVLDPIALGGGKKLQQPRYTLIGRPVPAYLASLYLYVGYFYFGMGVTTTLTDIGKVTVGRLRPHFIDVCKPDVDCSTLDPYRYIENATCLGDDSKRIHEARLSFPSGHSSFSAYTMIYLVLYLHSRMIWPIGGLLVKHMLQLVALILTLYTCMTRVNDFKHHWSDVVAGFISGFTVAVVTACHVVGLFRRPHWIFAGPMPHDNRNYTGGQLIGDFINDDDDEASRKTEVTAVGMSKNGSSFLSRDVK